LRRWLKVTLVVLVGLVALLLLNAVAVNNTTRDAEVNVDGAELVETSSGTLQILDTGGTGSPVVLIHGYTGSMNWFQELAPLLAAEHRVLSVDLLGHGGSDKPGAGYEITDQASAMAEALARLGVSDATVVGHSLGGTVATAVAEQSPELATRIVIIDQAPDDDYGDLSFTAELGYQPLIGPALQRLTEIAPNSAVRAQYDQAFAPDFNMASGFENPDQVVDDLREMTYTAFVDVSEAEGDYSTARSLDDRLSAIEVPVLVVFGSEDQIYDAEEAIAPFTDVPRAQTEVIDGVGHSPNVEDPERTAVLIEGFIARTRAAARAERRARAAKAANQRAARKAARARARARAKAKAGQPGGQKPGQQDGSAGDEGQPPTGQ
jgi:pimeloyl-ACP methyl ester carboxylesterase